MENLSQKYYIAIEKEYRSSFTATKAFDRISKGGNAKSYFKIIPRRLLLRDVKFSCGQWLESEILYIAKFFNPEEINTNNESSRGYYSIQFYYHDEHHSGYLRYYLNPFELRNRLKSQNGKHKDLLTMNPEILRAKQPMWEFTINYIPEGSKLLKTPEFDDKFFYYTITFESEPSNTSLLKAISNYYANSNSNAISNCHTTEEYREMAFKPESNRRHQNTKERINDFTYQVTQRFSGYINIVVQPPIPNGFPISYQDFRAIEKESKNRSENENISNNSFSLQTFTHIFEGVVDMFLICCNEKKSINLQIDTSFQIFRNYVFSLVIFMIGHTGFQLGYIIAPTESSEMYNQFFENLSHLFQPDQWKIVKALLFFQSDEGTALKKFYKENNFKHCFCHVHIVRKFGANSYLRPLISMGLRSIDQTEWEDNQKTIASRLQKMLNSSKSKIDITTSKFKSFARMFGLSVILNSSDQPSTCNQYDNSIEDNINEEEENGETSQTKEKEINPIILDGIRVELNSYDYCVDNSINVSNTFPQTQPEESKPLKSKYIVVCSTVPDDILETWALWMRHGMPAETNFIEGEHGKLVLYIINVKCGFVSKLVQFDNRCLEGSKTFPANYLNNFLKNLKLTLQKLDLLFTNQELYESALDHHAKRFSLQYPFPQITKEDINSLITSMHSSSFEGGVNFLKNFQYSNKRFHFEIDEKNFWDGYQTQYHKYLEQKCQKPKELKISISPIIWNVRSRSYDVKLNIQNQTSQELILQKINDVIKLVKFSNPVSDILWYTLIITAIFPSKQDILSSEIDIANRLKEINVKNNGTKLNSWQSQIYQYVKMISQKNFSKENLKQTKEDNSHILLNKNPQSINPNLRQNNTNSRQTNTNSLQFNSNPRQSNTNPLKLNSNPLQLNSNPLKLNSNPLKLNSNPLQSDTKPRQFIPPQSNANSRRFIPPQSNANSRQLNLNPQKFGIRNTGNTCYLNVFIQILAQIPMIHKAINTDYSLIIKMDSMKTDSSNQLSLNQLNDLLYILNELNTKTSNTKTLISHEFLGKDEKWLHEQQDVFEIFDLFFDYYSKIFNTNSNTYNLFSFKTRKVINVSKKNSQECPIEPLLKIDLSIDNQKNIQDALKYYFSTQEVDYDVNEKAQISYKMETSPQILLLHLKRLQPDNGIDTHKVNFDFSLNLNDLHISPTSDKNLYNYRLIGVVLHTAMNNMNNSGHYTYLSYSFQTKSWNWFNDSYVYHVDENNVLNFAGKGTVETGLIYIR